MNYERLYNSIIENAKKKLNKRKGLYTEKHHIVPKSLGGKNTKDNLVRLTAREHFICHWLLVKIYAKGSIERNKMLYAFILMSRQNKSQKRYIVSSRLFEKYKTELSDRARERWDRFHSGNWKSLSDFDKSEGRSPMTSCMMFKDSIPIYKSYKKSKRRRFVSDKSLIGVYE